MTAKISLGDFDAEVVFKAIKNIHLSVYPPVGVVKISAPAGMNLDTIRVFAVSKLPWIRQQQKKMLAQERETPREFLNRESHYLWGRRYLMKIEEREGAPGIAIKHSKLILSVRPGTDQAAKEAIVAQWYRAQLKAAALPLIEKWQEKMGVKARQLFVRHMRTQWGSCNPAMGNIRLNTELAKKPPECLEYIVVHELAHLIEPTHGERFVLLMDKHLTDWRHRKAMLNRLPVRHEEWGY